MSGLDGVLGRERLLVVAGMAAVTVPAWIYLWHGAGMGMSALEMTALGLFPHLQPDSGGRMEPGWLLLVSMWWVMMAAMMLPGATPLVLLY